ncbi:polyketide cyclase [Kaistia algarum]|uniref:SRPBCC family protein n=1 Tax=Kaistia algarum TaxID=2083279 RepID=UPI000CE7434F|nr:SRPBCC family protein [Kaistia algarum]MCX5513902.1 SRPBCC family protein [Kaistia algarum]PPE77537.1 polyketide cyclase [Kaistia algarum]
MKRSAVHATFVIEKHYPAPPERVFAAFADPKLKARWFVGPPEWGQGRHELDFRVGGREISSGGPKEGPAHRFEALYQDIVPDERIVFSYDLHLGDSRISVSLTTVEFAADLSGTKLTFTEQGVFLDGYDDAGSREHGTRELLGQLGASLAHGDAVN